METRTKMILALVGAGVTTLVIYMITRRHSSGAQMQPAPVVPSGPVPVINYGNKPVMGLGAFSDNATGKPSMKDISFEQRLSGQSDQMQTQDGVFKQRMGQS